MAKYRQVHITFWQDPFIEELQPLEKYFYLYLMTNSKTTQCGCYEISMKLIKYETGLSEEQLFEYIKLFEEHNKIAYDKSNMEFLVLNWLKHNSFKSPKVLTCIENEVQQIKTIKFKQYVKGILDGNTTMYSLSKSMDSLSKSIDTGSQQEQEQEEEYNNNNKQEQTLILTSEQSEYFNILKTIPDYPFDTAKDLDYYIIMEGRYPSIDLVQAVEDFKIYKMDKPFENNSKHRSQLNTAFRNCVEWGKCIKKKPTVHIEDDNPFVPKGVRDARY